MAGATGDRCADLDPSNGLAPYLDMAAGEPAIELADGATINTETGTIVSNGQVVIVSSAVVAQTGTDVKLRVFVAKQLVLRGTQVTGAMALAFVAEGPVQVNGELDAAADHTVGGAGSEPGGPCSGARGSTGGETASFGAGGAGNATEGGPGGGNNFERGGRGPIRDSDLQPLVGGCSGGAVEGVDNGGGTVIDGGAGGGAIELVSRTSITVAVSGTSIGKIHVGGGGAVQGLAPFNQGYSGAGSGGGVLLEAPAVVLSGAGAIVAANGGSGGACAGGENATASTTVAPGAPECTAPPFIGAGGNGAATTSVAGGGAFGRTGAGGGGGGGLGYLVVRTTTGQFAPQNGAAVSAKLKQLPLRTRPRT
jgi:hypothetical protein